MITIDFKDAYLQIPILPRSRKFLRFMAGGRAWQFKVLCFGLSTAPQVFTRVMAPVSGFLHHQGVRILRYLDSWLIMASSREEACWARDMVLHLCQELGIVVNLEKSNLTPSQSVVYLGIKIESQTFQASPTLSRIEKFFLIVEEFLSPRVQSAKFCRSCTRTPRIIDAPSSRWPTLNEGSSVSSQEGLGFSGRLGLGSLGQSLPRGSSVVVRRG